MDIGCGSEARLVNMLRQKGVEAEGIDPTLPRERDYLMKLKIKEGCPIPRPDKHYHAVVCIGFPSFSKAFTNLSKIYSRTEEVFGFSIGYPPKEARKIGEFVLLEGLRVMSDEGRFLIYDGLDNLGDFAQILKARGYHIGQRAYTGQSCKKERDMMRQAGFMVGLTLDDMKSMDFFTVITRGGKN